MNRMWMWTLSSADSRDRYNNYGEPMLCVAMLWTQQRKVVESCLFVSYKPEDEGRALADAVAQYHLRAPMPTSVLAGWELSDVVLPYFLNRCIACDLAIPWRDTHCNPMKRFSGEEGYDVSTVWKQGCYKRCVPPVETAIQLWTGQVLPSDSALRVGVVGLGNPSNIAGFLSAAFVSRTEALETVTAKYGEMA